MIKCKGKMSNLASEKVKKKIRKPRTKKMQLMAKMVISRWHIGIANVRSVGRRRVARHFDVVLALSLPRLM